MTERRISSTELVRTIGDVLGRVRFRGDSFVIEKNDKPVAILAPYSDARRRSLRDVLRAWAEAGEPDEKLADLLEEVERSDAPLENPWESS